MADSPRAPKRRKLDTPSHSAPSPLAKASTTRKSDRTPSSQTNGITKRLGSETLSKSVSRTALRKINGTQGQQAANGSTDVWDDIEGALGETPSKKSTSKPPKPTRKGSARKASALLEDPADESPSTDELQKETPTRRRGRNAVNGKGSSSKPASLKKPRASTRTRSNLEHEDALLVTTPSARRKGGRQRRFEDDETIPETEDELVDKPASPSKTASTRSRKRRADRVNDRSAEIVDTDEDQADTGAQGSDGGQFDDDAMSVDGNSILESVLDPTEPSPFNKPSSAQKGKSDIPPLSGFIETGRELELLRTIVLERISGRRPAPLVGLDSQYKFVQQLIEQTVSAGEGNSMLLIGARGSGKTALVNKALTEISKDNSHDYHVVRLNGFIHTDDKIALREIWRQLGKEMELEEEGGGVGKNYADTLTTLLALLSHPSEHTGVWTEEVSKAVVFIIDEFDLFAYHPRQTLLYNLFDVAQSRKAPIAVLGLTTRISMFNMLEKRVKSRFSHRYVHLSLAKTFTAFQEMCKVNLLIQPDFLSVEERGILESATPKKYGKKSKTKAHENVLSHWNSCISALFTSKSFLTTHLAPLFYRSKSIPSALTSFLLPTSALTSTLSRPTLSLSHPPDSKLALIPHLPTLAVALLIAATRLDIIHDSDTCNFNMAYDEYVTLASKARIQSAAGGTSATGGISKVWGKEVARKEWEGLVELGLIMPAVGSGIGVGGGFGMVKCDVSLEEIGAVVAGEKGLERGLEKWCKQI